MSGTSDKIKGRVKEAVGVLTDDQASKERRESWTKPPARLRKQWSA